MTCLLADISLHAGGGWEGHTFFLVKHPVTKKQISANSLKEVKNFCKENNLEIDPILFDVLANLEFDQKYGWLVPKRSVDKQFPVSSSNKFLKEISKDLDF